MCYLTLVSLAALPIDTMRQQYVYSNQKSLFNRNSDATTLLMQEEMTVSFCIFFRKRTRVLPQVSLTCV